MQFTGQLGTAESVPGGIVPGFFCAGTATWKGPFPAGEVAAAAAGKAGITDMVSGTLTVTPAVASQLAAGDASWWEFH